MDNMGDLSQHFSRVEFRCHCHDDCGFDTVDVALLSALEQIRKHFGKPIAISSAARCKKMNKKAGGSPKSQHLLGRAADIAVKDTAPEAVQEFADTILPDSGVGSYNMFTHIDTRRGRARWNG